MTTEISVMYGSEKVKDKLERLYYYIFFRSEICFKISTPVTLISFSQQARDVDPTLIQCLFNVYDTGQALAERLVLLCTALAYMRFYQVYHQCWIVPFGEGTMTNKN